MGQLNLVAAVERDLLGVGDDPGVDRAQVALPVGLLGHQQAELGRHRLEDLAGGADHNARQQRARNDVGAHAPTGLSQGQPDERAVEQRLGEVRVQVRHRGREGRDVVRQPVVRVLDAPVQVGHAVVGLVGEVLGVGVVHQPSSEC